MTTIVNDTGWLLPSEYLSDGIWSHYTVRVWAHTAHPGNRGVRSMREESVKFFSGARHHFFLAKTRDDFLDRVRYVDWEDDLAVPAWHPGALHWVALAEENEDERA
jgi:hypothetical protein